MHLAAHSEYHRYCSSCYPLDEARESCREEWEQYYLKYSPNDVQFWNRFSVMCTSSSKACPSTSTYLYDYETWSEYIPQKDEILEKNDICFTNITLGSWGSGTANKDYMTTLITITREDVKNYILIIAFYIYIIYRRGTAI